MAKKLKLYVWEGVLTDYTSGVAFALAASVDEARDVIMQSEGEPSYKEAKYHGALWNDISSEPQVFEVSKGFAVWGGG